MWSSFSIVLNLSTINFLSVILAFNWKQQNNKIMSKPWNYVTMPLLCWPLSSIKIMNSKLLIMKKYLMCKYFYFVHAHFGYFVNFWWVTARMSTITNGAPPPNFSTEKFLQLIGGGDIFSLKSPLLLKWFNFLVLHLCGGERYEQGPWVFWCHPEEHWGHPNNAGCLGTMVELYNNSTIPVFWDISQQLLHLVSFLLVGGVLFHAYQYLVCSTQ